MISRLVTEGKKGHTKAVMIDGKITARLTDLDQKEGLGRRGLYLFLDVGLSWEYVQHVTDIACRLAVVPTSIPLTLGVVGVAMDGVCVRSP